MASSPFKAPDYIRNVAVSKSITRAAKASYSQEKISYNMPSGYKLIGVTTTMSSSEYLQPVLTGYSNSELTYMIKNDHSAELTRTLYANLILTKNN